jgi:hypothetical protein
VKECTVKATKYLVWRNNVFNVSVFYINMVVDNMNGLAGDMQC